MFKDFFGKESARDVDCLLGNVNADIKTDTHLGVTIASNNDKVLDWVAHKPNIAN